MTDQLDSLHHDALGMLDSAGQLAARAVRMALRALPESNDSRWTDDQTLTRATQIATIAAASARVAHGLVAAEHVDLLREFEGRVDARVVSENDQPDAFPCPDCDYVAPNSHRLGDHLVTERRRDPYDPPTLTGPYDPDREHDR